MKKQDIFKKIGMPNVDEEWSRFESSIIDNEFNNSIFIKKQKKAMIKKIAAIIAIAICFSGVVLATVIERNLSADNEQKTDTTVETKPLVEFHEQYAREKNVYTVHLCPGTWIKNSEGKEYLENQYLTYSFAPVKGGTVIMLLNSKTFDKDNLPKLTNKELKKIETSKKGEDLIVNLITTLTTEPVDVASNIPTEFTILLPGGGKIDMTFRKAQEGNWMNCSFTHWPTNSKSWNVVKELERIKAKDIPGFTVYVYSSTETEQKDIDRATAVLDQAGIKNIVYKKNIPIKHFTDEELRQWAEKEKASGTPLRDLYDKMAPQGMSVTDVRSQWHIVNEVYGVKK